MCQHVNVNTTTYKKTNYRLHTMMNVIRIWYSISIQQIVLIAAKIESSPPTVRVFCSLEWDCMVRKTDCNFSGLTSFRNPLKCCLLPAKSYEKVPQATNITVPPLRATVPFPIVCARELVDHLYRFPPLLPLIDTDLLPVLVSCSPSPTIWMLPNILNQRSLDSESQGLLFTVVSGEFLPRLSKEMTRNADLLLFQCCSHHAWSIVPRRLPTWSRPPGEPLSLNQYPAPPMS